MKPNRKLILTSWILWTVAGAATLLTILVGFDGGPRPIGFIAIAAALVIAFAAGLARAAALFPRVFPEDFFSEADR